MKRLYITLLTVIALLLASCTKPAYPTITGYGLEEVKGLSWEEGGVSTNVILNINVTNTSSSRFEAESGTAVLYKENGAKFATIEILESASIGPKETGTVALPLKVILANPLSLLTSGGLNLEGMRQLYADIDVKVRMGAISKNIREKMVPLDQLAEKINLEKK